MSSRKKRKFYEENPERYDFLKEETDEEANGIVYVYHTKPPYFDSKLICLVFSNYQLNQGSVEWFVDKQDYPNFFKVLLELSEILE